jgi:hypothetical protein
MLIDSAESAFNSWLENSEGCNHTISTKLVDVKQDHAREVLYTGMYRAIQMCHHSDRQDTRPAVMS